MLTKHNKYRNDLEKLYNHLYKKDYELDQRKCRYCNDPFYCYDHRPAITLLPSMNLERYIKEGGKFQFVPCCKDCNKYLAANCYTDILDCLFYLKCRYMQSIYDVPIWTEDELKEMSQYLQAIIIKDQVKRNIISNKIDEIYYNIVTYK